MNSLSPLVNRVQDKKYKSAPVQTKQRKTRSDKKHDVRIPVTDSEKWWVRTFAGEKGMSMTRYSTQLVEKGLGRSIDYPEYKYQDSENIVHAKIDQMTYKELVHLSANWDCSIRQTAYRIFKHILLMEINEG